MEKQALRERIWDELDERGVARFPFPPHGSIPNVDGADDAAERLATLEAWHEAEVTKANPDSPQRPVRGAALRAGKTVYMAVPRLRDEDCFLHLDPATIGDIDHAITLGGSSELGEQVGLDGMEPIDLIISGSVAVNPRGARVGKGEGYSDLEFAILRESGLVDDDTTTVTTVHEIQVVDDEIPTESHDVPMDLIVTPERTIRTSPTRSKPSGIAWADIDEEQLGEIPVLQRLRSA